MPCYTLLGILLGWDFSTVVFISAVVIKWVDAYCLLPKNSLQFAAILWFPPRPTIQLDVFSNTYTEPADPS